jgi:hypothetical protein
MTVDHDAQVAEIEAIVGAYLGARPQHARSLQSIANHAATFELIEGMRLYLIACFPRHTTQLRGLVLPIQSLWTACSILNIRASYLVRKLAEIGIVEGLE